MRDSFRLIAFGVVLIVAMIAILLVLSI